MLLIVLVYFSLADEDMIKRLLNKHVENVVILMLKEKRDEAWEKGSLAYLFENFYAWNRDAMAVYLYKLGTTSRSL